MKKFLFFLSLSAAMTALCNSDTPSIDPDDNLISHEFFKQQLSWVNPGQLWSHHIKPRTVEVRNEVFILSSPNGRTNAYVPLNIGYETADRFRLVFEYRLKGEGYVALDFQNSIKKTMGGLSVLSVHS